MTDRVAGSATPNGRQRRIRPVVTDGHDRSDVSVQIDQTQFLIPLVASPEDDMASTPHEPAVTTRVVTLFALTATSFVVLAGILSTLLRATTSLPPLAIDLAVGAVLVLGSSGLLWLALRRWGSQMAAAADAERRARENLTEVNRLRAAFLGAISHELRTPMTNILGFAQTIRAHHRSLEPDRLESFADRLVANTSRLEQLVVDLLDLHQDDAQPELKPVPVHLEQLLRGAIVANGPRAQRICVWPATKWVVVDRTRVERIVGEMVSNVLKHTPPSTEAWLRAETRGGRLVVSMEDDGPGIDPAIVAEATVPFVQGERAQASHSPGLGIGLSLAARYAEMLGGTLTISTPSGGGTRVEVSVPYEPVGPGMAA